MEDHIALQKIITVQPRPFLGDDIAKNICIIDSRYNIKSDALKEPMVATTPMKWIAFWNVLLELCEGGNFKPFLETKNFKPITVHNLYSTTNMTRMLKTVFALFETKEADDILKKESITTESAEEGSVDVTIISNSADPCPSQRSQLAYAARS